MHPTKTVSLLIVHEDALMAAGMAAVLSRDSTLEVEVCPTGACLDAYAERCIDVVAADFNSGSAWLQMVQARSHGRARAAQVVIVTALNREVDVRAALHAGAAGYLRQSCQPEELVHAVLSVARGARYICPSVSGCLADSLTHAALTSREADVLGLVAGGLCNKAIARTLEISLGTVKAHVSAILYKLRAQSRTEAIVRAAQRGLVTPSTRAPAYEPFPRTSLAQDRVPPGVAPVPARFQLHAAPTDLLAA